MTKFSSTRIEKLICESAILKDMEEPLTNSRELLFDCYSNGGKVLVCGNGGSAADAEHIVGELMKGFLRGRPIPQNDYLKIKQKFPDEADSLAESLQGALPAISLVSQTSLITAFANDVSPDMVFAQQVYGYGKEGDVLIAISTSGNSKNVVRAAKVAVSFGMKVIAMTGKNGGELGELCDVLIAVPSEKTYEIQEHQVKIYHALCADIEASFFES